MAGLGIQILLCLTSKAKLFIPHCVVWPKRFVPQVAYSSFDSDLCVWNVSLTTTPELLITSEFGLLALPLCSADGIGINSLCEVKEVDILNTDWQCLVICFSSNYKIVDLSQYFNSGLTLQLPVRLEKKIHICTLPTSSKQTLRRILIYLFWGVY